MAWDLKIGEIFRLEGGTTVLACEGGAALGTLLGQRVSVVVDGKVRQSIVLLNGHRMLNQGAHLNQRALETHDIVDVLPDEVKNGICRLVSE